MILLFKVNKLSSRAIDKITYDDSPSFSGIVAGECKGDMWVDDVENPNIALVGSFAVGGFSILGEPSNVEVYSKFKDFMIEDMFYKLKSKGVNYFEFSIESEKTKPYILDIFCNKVIQIEDEYIFRKNDKYNESITVPDGYKIFKVDSNFLGKLDSDVFDNQEFLVERLLESWGTYDDFLKKSVAFVAANQNIIVAVIIGTAWRELDGERQLVEINYQDLDWPNGYEYHYSRLKATILNRGSAIGAFDNNGKLLGFATINREFFGKDYSYVLLEQLFITLEYRSKGIGKKLFMLSAEVAKEWKADKVYICAGSAEETIAFYFAIGCKEAVEINKELYESDPRDYQLEYSL